MSEPTARVIIVMGSPADREWTDGIVAALQRYTISPDVYVASAHKTPGYLLGLIEEWEAGDTRNVYITVAGRSNALSGFLDAQVKSPVLACPPASSAYGGADIFSSLRMPRGVAPLVVLEPENAALAAAKIIGLFRPEVRDAVETAQEAERNRVLRAGQ